MKHTLRQLEVFVAIARLENVSRAAEALSLSQSAASTALAELERQFDCKLFDRMGKVLKLNELGRSLLPMAAALLDRAAEIESILQGKSAFGLLKVGATLTIGNYLAALFIGSFMRQHKDCQVQLHVQNTNSVMHQVAQYDLDIGLIEGDCHHPELEVEPWIEDELTVFCTPQHPLAQKKNATLHDLLQENWILREDGSGTRETFDHALRHHHTQLNVRLVLEHTEAIKRAVESGLGLGCISRLALKDDIARGNLVAIETPELDLKRQFMFVWHKKKYQTTAVREFLNHCRSLTHNVQRSDEINIPYIP
ncbi:transcriptional regulator, LysR family [Methylobacillus rhizosphaerae]|uniref:Transcriptional regulator, LysR family n=1 Tax=Methylobacillus rhizosphaerae TaxID=551994 RepID=A0A239AES6_9PROT|nr:LysR family transcriptional regulator [Methylobacillus rhizosphaerae]SNR94095.1 transcriptional regulator, LysR family [Methylobacillus rhizosphaerae]